MYKMRWVTGSAKHHCFSTSTFCFSLDRAWASNQIHSTRFDRPDVLVCVHSFSVPSADICAAMSVRPYCEFMSARPLSDQIFLQLFRQDLRPNLRQNILQNFRQNNLQNLRQNILQNLDQNFAQNLRQHLLQKIRQKVLQNLRQNILQNLRQNVLQKI